MMAFNTISACPLSSCEENSDCCGCGSTCEDNFCTRGDCD